MTHHPETRFERSNQVCSVTNRTLMKTVVMRICILGSLFVGHGNAAEQFVKDLPEVEHFLSVSEVGKATQNNAQAFISTADRSEGERIGEQDSFEEQFSGFGLGEPRALVMSNTEHTPSTGHPLYTTEPLSTFVIDYGHEAVAHDEKDRETALTFDHRGGARWRSHFRFEHGGTFTVKIKTPDGDTSGLNTSFYLSSLEGDKSQDEIDFEFLGKDKRIVQTNYYTSVTGNREEIHDLGFDSSEAFHEYTIRWLHPSVIEWLIDGVIVRREEKKHNDEAFPVKPMYLYASLWNAGDINNGSWAGPYIGSHAPYVSKYREVNVPVQGSQVQS